MVRSKRTTGTPRRSLFVLLAVLTVGGGIAMAVRQRVRQILAVELSAGQMIEDAKLATRCRIPISFFGKMGGVMPLPEDVLEEIRRLV